MGILANSADPDEMQHNAAFHQGPLCLLRLNNFQGQKFIIKKFLTVTPKVQNGQSHTYCCISSGSALFAKIKIIFRV